MRWSVVASVMLVACDGRGDESSAPYCKDTAEDIALDEVTELGFSAAQVAALATAGSPYAEDFRWDEGGTTALDLAITTGDGGARFVRSEVVYPEGSEQLDIYVECPDRVEIDAAVTFATADGAFDEAWAAPLASEDGVVARLYVELDPDALGGTYDVVEHITEPDWKDVSLWADGRFQASGTSGAISGQVTGEEECHGEECTAWASEMRIGAWGPPQE